MTDETVVEEAFENLAGEPETKAEARNGLRHMASLTMTKVADGLIDPKLVLSYLLNALGAPVFLVSALVPIREAGALLPQILLATRLERMKARRFMWVAGSVGQGVAAAAIALAAVTLEGVAAGWAFVGAIALLALSRAAASVSYKDVLGKTVGKSRRGAVTGFAGSASAALVFVYALLLVSGLVEGTVVLAIAIALAAVLWGMAAILFSTLEEPPSDPNGENKGLRMFGLLREDKTFARFVAARGFLTVTSLAPPYFVLLAGDNESGLGTLGALVIASSAASFLSSYAWGRFSDKSSRLVLATAGLVAAAAMALAIMLHLVGLSATIWAIPAALFLLMIAYHGVRQGRSTYLVDMSPEDSRAVYAATANTLIGGLLLVSGAFGGVLSFIGPVAALTGFAILAVTGGLIALGLEEAEAN
ncbi:MAG TPA: MFS transporter [Maritimibacter sp.]|nr:MFS transporter [Maritimibacter sp.]